MKPADTVNDQMPFAAVEDLPPAAKACVTNSCPKPKLKFSIEEKSPEKIHMTRPRTRPDRATCFVPRSRSLRRPAIASKTKPMVIARVPAIKSRPWLLKSSLGWRTANGRSEPNEPVMPRMRANPTATPTRLIPSPKSVTPTPHVKAKKRHFRQGIR